MAEPVVGELSRAIKPRLLVFGSLRSGRSRRSEGHLAQVLQRRGNHDTFAIQHLAQEERPELFERFRIQNVPSFLVVEGRHVRGRLVAPRGSKEIEEFLAPWLRR